ncbi:MAG: hypothetical protein ACK528_05555, partial [Alphaproteobacteria bacterium]
MAVIFNGPLPDGETATNDLGVRKYTRQYGLSTTASEGPYTVGSNNNLPRIGSVHYEDPQAWCRSLTVARAGGKDRNNWTVTANYDSSFELSENPLVQPAQISWDGENFEEVAIFDRDNKAVLNSAGDPFEGLFRERTRRVISIVKNVAAVPDWIITSEDAVNSLAFVVDGFAVPIGKAKLSAPRLGPWEFRNNTRFRQMTMTMKLNKDGWAAQPLDAGFRYKSGTDRKIITNTDGTLPTSPVCLN